MVPRSRDSPRSGECFHVLWASAWCLFILWLSMQKGSLMMTAMSMLARADGRLSVSATLRLHEVSLQPYYHIYDACSATKRCAVITTSQGDILANPSDVSIIRTTPQSCSASKIPFLVIMYKFWSKHPCHVRAKFSSIAPARSPNIVAPTHSPHRRGLFLYTMLSRSGASIPYSDLFLRTGTTVQGELGAPPRPTGGNTTIAIRAERSGTR
jgi:hypothetical protein